MSEDQDNKHLREQPPEPDAQGQHHDGNAVGNNAGNSQIKGKWKTAKITIAVFGLIECLALVLWQIAENSSSSVAIRIHWLSECGFLAGGAFLVQKALKKPIACPIVWMLYILACFVLLFTESPIPKDANAPKVFPSTVRLGDGNNTVQSSVTVFNPSDFPVFGVVLQLGIKGTNVRADSINIRLADADLIPSRLAQAETIYADAFTYRWDLMQEASNQLILFVISSIPANGRRFVEIGGTRTTVSSLQVKVEDYKKEPLEILGNGVTNIFCSPTVALKLKGVWMGSNGVVFLSGSVTNYPVERRGIWHHFRMGFLP